MFFNTEKASSNLLFHPGCLFQVPPPAPSDLKNPSHPKEPNTRLRYYISKEHVEESGGGPTFCPGAPSSPGRPGRPDSPVAPGSP